MTAPQKHVPGALAIVQGCWHQDTNGKTCELLHLVPKGHSTMPSGYPIHNAVEAPAWMVKFQGRLMVLNDGGTPVLTEYCPIVQACLKVIGGPDIDMGEDTGEDLWASPYVPSVTHAGVVA